MSSPSPYSSSELTSPSSSTAAGSLAGLAGLYSGSSFAGATSGLLGRGPYEGSLGGALGNLAAAAACSGTMSLGSYDGYNQKGLLPSSQHSIDGILGRRDEKDTSSESIG